MRLTEPLEALEVLVTMLSGTVALVTGAAGGIGAAVAVALAEQGAVVAATDLDAGAVEVAVKAAYDDAPAGSATGRVSSYRLDVTSAKQVDDVVAQVEADLGPIGVLANVAGVLIPARVLGLDDSSWQRTFAVNSTGVMMVSRRVAAGMAARGAGAIVTVGSNAGGVPRIGMAAYAASKAAAAMFTKSLGLELARSGVRCNVVSPGSTETPMLQRLWDGDPDGRAATLAGSPDQFRVGIPLGRVADPRDVAEAVVFLASPKAQQITMHDLYVDGGASLRG